MNRNWLHPNRPNVPQPPYNLQTQPDVAPLRTGRSRAASSPGQAAEPGYAQATGSTGSAPSRRAGDVPPVPKVPSNYASPHHNAFHSAGGVPMQRDPTPTQAPSGVSFVTGSSSSVAPADGLRRMTAEERQAYIREVDARNAAAQAEQGGGDVTDHLVQQAARSSGLRPLRLSQSTTQLRQAPGAPQQTGSTGSRPSADAESQLSRYYEDLYAEPDRPAPPDTPSDPEEHPFPEALTGSTSSAPAPLDVPVDAPPSPPLTPTYASTAHNAGTAHRVPATASYDIPAAATGHGRQASVTVTPTAPGAAVGPLVIDGANTAVVEIFSHGEVVARISLPYPGGR